MMNECEWPKLWVNYRSHTLRSKWFRVLWLIQSGSI